MTKNELNFTLQDFCYRPILGETCLVTSPMEYWQDDLTKLEADTDPKVTA